MADWRPGVLKFAFLIEPPFCYRTPDGAVTGCDVELARLIARQIGADSFDPIETEFALPGFGVPLAVSARVAWADAAAGRLGLAFEPLDVAVAELLQSVVAGRFSAG